MKPTTIGLLLGLVLGLLAALLGRTGLVRGFERGPYDALVRAFAEPEKARDSKVHVLLLTEDDLTVFREAGEATLAYFPPPRNFWGDVLDVLREKRPGAITLDILMPNPARDPAEDAALKQAIENAGNVAQAFSVFPRAATGTTEALTRNATVETYGPDATLTEGADLRLPAPGLRDAPARLGNAFVAPDADGVVRKIPVAMRVQDHVVPSLSLATAMIAFHESSVNVAPDGRALRGFASIDVPVDGAGHLLLNFRGPRGSFPTMTVTQLFADLMFGREPSAEARAWLESLDPGDIVVFGANVLGNPDLVSAPTDDALPGPELIATAVDNILRGDARTPVPAWISFAITILLGAGVGVLTVLSSRKNVAIVLVVPVALLYAGAVALLFWGGLVLDVVTPLSGVGFSYLGSALFLYQTEGRKRREIRRTFSQYVAPEIVSELEQHPEHLRLGGDKRVMTVMFSDLAGFTGISEKMQPEELVTFLNEYLTAMTDTILEHGGVIDKYLGDAIMAFWGAPLKSDDHARKALAAVAACQERLQAFAREKEALGLPRLFARTGINTGTLVVGNMGSNRRFDYTVMGDSVNLASRLEGANKFFGSVVMLAQETLDAAGADAAITRPLGRLRVKGRAEPVAVHELLGAGGAGLASVPDWVRTFAEGIEHFEGARFKQAEASFQAADAARPGGDPVARRFLEICADHAREFGKKGKTFDGVITLTEK